MLGEGFDVIKIDIMDTYTQYGAHAVVGRDRGDTRALASVAVNKHGRVSLIHVLARFGPGSCAGGWVASICRALDMCGLPASQSIRLFALRCSASLPTCSATTAAGSIVKGKDSLHADFLSECEEETQNPV
jgi:ligand-binding sensor protein